MMRSWIAVSAFTLCAAAAARADTPAPQTYAIDESPPGRVTILPVSHGQRTCPDEGLLRRDVATGAVARITTCDGDAFVDDCVPAGTYEYGLAVPYACEPTGGVYYRRVTVVGADGGDCIEIPDEPADGVPWGVDPDVCAGGDASGCATAGTAVLGGNLLLLLAGLALRARRTLRRRRG
jgi:hypothetical protein